MRKGSLLNKWCLENWTDTCKEMNIVPHTKNQIEMNYNLNIKPESIKILEENVGNKLLSISVDMDFFI